MPNIVIVLLYFLSLLLVWQFVGYPLVMGIIAFRVKPKKKNYSFTPFISILVPAYNEEKVIEGRIKNLDSLDYPKDKYEIIIVESGSSDSTAQIVNDLISNRREGEPVLRLITEDERRGKASAINTGREAAKGEIVLVTDGNAHFSENVLKEIAPHFEDENVGAVGGRYALANPEQGLASEESFYWDLEYMMRMGESALDSACLFHGEINAWRKSLVKADRRMVSEDLDMAIHIRRQGFKIVYERMAICHETTGSTAEEQIIRRKRPAAGTLQAIRKHWTYFFFPRDLYSLFIFPSHKGLVMLSPFFLIAILLLYIVFWNVKIIALHVLITGLGFGLLFGGLLSVKFRLLKSEPNKPHRSGISIGSLFEIIKYVLLNEYLLLLAWKDFALGKYTVLWDRSESTRVSLDKPM